MQDHVILHFENSTTKEPFPPVLGSQHVFYHFNRWSPGGIHPNSFKNRVIRRESRSVVFVFHMYDYILSQHYQLLYDSMKECVKINFLRYC